MPVFKRLAFILLTLAAFAAFASTARAGGFLVAVATDDKTVLYSDSNVVLLPGELIYVYRKGRKVATLSVETVTPTSVTAIPIVMKYGIKLEEYRDKAWHSSELAEMEEEGKVPGGAEEPPPKEEGGEKAADAESDAEGEAPLYEAPEELISPVGPKLVWKTRIRSPKVPDPTEFPPLRVADPLTSPFAPAMGEGVRAEAVFLDLGTVAPARTYRKEIRGEIGGLHAAMAKNNYEVSFGEFDFNLKQAGAGGISRDLRATYYSLKYFFGEDKLKMSGVLPDLVLGGRAMNIGAQNVFEAGAKIYWHGGKPVDFQLGITKLLGDTVDKIGFSAGLNYRPWRSAALFIDYEYHDFFNQIANGPLLMEELGLPGWSCNTCRRDAISAGAALRFLHDGLRLRLAVYDINDLDAFSSTLQYRF